MGMSPYSETAVENCMSKVNISFNKVSWYLMLPLVLFHSFALANCFIIKELNSSSFIQKEGECQSRVAPCSTFKIPLALMGLESKILENAENPSWAFKKEYEGAYHVCRDKWDGSLVG